MRRDGGGRRPSPNRHNRTGAPGAVLDSKQVQGAQPSMGEKALEEMKDLEPFNAMGIMNEGLSVLPEDGNRTLKAITEKVAPIISKEDVWTDDEVKEVKTAYIKLYSVEPCGD